MCQNHPIVIPFNSKIFLLFAKKEENNHESGRKLTLKIIFFKKLLKIISMVI